MKSRVTVLSNGSPGHKGPRCGLASGARGRTGLSRGAAERGPGVRGRGWSRDAGAQDERAPQKTTRLGLPGAPAPGRAAARAPRAPAAAAAPPTRGPLPPTTRDGRPCTHASLRPVQGRGRDRASLAARADPQGPEAAARGRLRPSVQPGTLGGRGRRYPGRLPPSGLHQRGPEGCGVTHFLDVTETFSSL